MDETTALTYTAPSESNPYGVKYKCSQRNDNSIVPNKLGKDKDITGVPFEEIVDVQVQVNCSNAAE